MNGNATIFYTDGQSKVKIPKADEPVPIYIQRYRA